jgi:hypothetical protein
LECPKSGVWLIHQFISIPKGPMLSLANRQTLSGRINADVRHQDWTEILKKPNVNAPHLILSSRPSESIMLSFILRYGILRIENAIPMEKHPQATFLKIQNLHSPSSLNCQL